MGELRGLGKLSRMRLSEVLRNSSGCVSVALVAKTLNASREQARFYLSAWTKGGWLRRIRRGLYCPVELAAKSPNEIFLDPWVIASQVFSPCYIGGWSAAKYWDFTEQIFESIVVLTTRRPLQKKQYVGGGSFLLKKIATDKLFGLKSVWMGEIKVQVSDPHRTIVDILDDPSLGGGIRSVIDFFRKYLSSHDCNLETLVQYAEKIGNKTVFKRLGFLLSKIQPGETNWIAYCIQRISQGNTQLDPTSKGKRLVKRWRLWIPAGLEGGMSD
ncbi:MAG: type IV toxin-antitoxin system AbiEi family antitoxin domain-containing protein [Chlamydiales bacterium]